MTQFARWQATIVDDEGNILPAASVEVRNEATGSLVTLYADRLGASGKSNPFAADSEGFAFFHAAGGAYKITATKGGFTREWRYVALGRGGEHDDLDGVSFGTLRTAVLDSPLDTDADPGEGAITFDSASMASVTEIAISTKNTEASDEADYIDQLDDNAATVKTRLLVRNRLDPWVDWAIFELTGVTTPAESPTPDYRKLAVTYVDHGGNFEDGMVLVIADSPTGEQGFVGSDGTDPGVLFNFDDGTSDADPGSGNIRANNAALGSATELYVSKTNRSGNNVATWLATLDDSTNVSRLGGIVLTRPSDGAQVMYDLDSVADETAYVKLTVVNPSGATSFTDGQPISLQFYRDGDKGSDGAGAVDSVNGQTGAVTLTAADIGFADSPAPFGATDVEDALNSITAAGVALSPAVLGQSDVQDALGKLATLAPIGFKRFTSSTTYTPTSGTLAAIVTVQGSGGGSGGTGNTAGTGRSGHGGNGETRRGVVAITGSETITIAAGGTAGSSGNNAGGSASASSFGSHISAGGGTGGGGSAGNDNGTSGSPATGSGGVVIPQAGAGINASGAIWGPGGPMFSGLYYMATPTVFAGISGLLPGGGAPGSADNGTTARAGGTGLVGYIEVIEFGYVP